MLTPRLMVPTKILLVDRTPALVRAWSEVFANYESVTAIEGDFFAREADAMVSPANSFGNMDGGLDAAIRDGLGGTIEGAVKRVILEKHHGELTSARPKSWRPRASVGPSSSSRPPCACPRASRPP